MNTSPTPILVDPPQKPKRSFGRRMLKTSLWTLLLLFSLIVLTSVIIAAFFEEQISKRLISEINKQLKTELRVADFNLSLLSGFPDVSADLKRIELDDAMKGTLLEADKVSFRFGLLSLLSSSVKVHSVVIEDGALFIRINKRGKLNYDIVKASDEPEENTSSNDFAISLDQAQLKNIEVIYVDDRARQEVRMLVEDASATGQFSNEAFSMTSVASMRSEFMELNKNRYLVDQELVYDAQMNVDLANRRYELESVQFGVGANLFNLAGIVESKGSNSAIDLQVTSNQGSIESVIDLLPEQYLDYFSDFKSSGSFSLDGTIIGNLNEKEFPAIEVDFGLEDGSVSSPRLKSDLQDVTFTATYTNGRYRKNSSSIFEIKDFKGLLHRQLIESRLRIQNFDDPQIKYSLSGVVSLEDIYGLFDLPQITGADGEVEVNRLLLKGRLRDMGNPKFMAKVKMSGDIEFDDATLNFGGRKVVFDRGHIKLSNNKIFVEDVKIEAPGSELNLSGEFSNLIPVLLADSTNTRKAELRFKAELEAPTLDIDQLIALSEAPEDSRILRKSAEVDKSKKAVGIKNRERFTSLLKGTFEARIDEFNFNLIEGQRFLGSLQFDNNELRVKGNAEGMDGAFKVDGKMFFEEKPYLKAKVEMAGIDVREFFRQCENFGQEVVEAQHLKGDLQSQMIVNAYWQSDGTFIDDQLQILGDVNITDGELIGLRMLYDFSEYIKIRDLKHIKFTSLRNWLEVRKGKVYIPSMFVQSNAMNLTFSGIHGFDSRINYNFKINAGQVLLNKLKKYNSTMRPHRAERRGWFNLYYRLYGTTTDFVVKQDKRTAKRNFADSEHRKREIRAALLKEFEAIDNYLEPSDWADESSSAGEEEHIEFDSPEENTVPESSGTTPVEEEDEYIDFGKDNDPETDDEEYINWEDDGGGQ